MSEQIEKTNVIHSRNFLPKDFSVANWNSVEPYLTELRDRNIESFEEFEKWIKDRSEIESVISEDERWRYMRTTIDTTDKKAEEDLSFFYEQIKPHLKKINFELNQKFIESPYLSQLDQDKYFNYIREIQRRLELFNEENIELFKEQDKKQNEYGSITGLWTVEVNGEELTFQQAQILLKKQDRAIREEVWKKINARKTQDADKLDELLSELIQIRHKIAKNAGYDNYRDYKFADLCRFDYTPEDCFEFHRSIAEEVVPIVNELQKERKQELGLDALRPWDTTVDTSGKPPMKPVDSSEELIQKTKQIFDLIDPYFGNCIQQMNDRDFFDLDSRIGKAPGGYNMTLPETGMPFIFMNSANSEGDVRVMMHEGGHAIHTFLSHPLEINGFKDYPSEVAELASMSMELMSMDHWNVFYSDDEELRRAKRSQLIGVLSGLPAIARGDAFQHWLYTNPDHTIEERRAYWLELEKELGGSVIDWSGFENDRSIYWQRILHFYEVPFYFIEYAMAQLGAVAVWMNFQQDRSKAIQQYKDALKLGYTSTIPEIYNTAGIKFDFSKEYVRHLAEFVHDEIKRL